MFTVSHLSIQDNTNNTIIMHNSCENTVSAKQQTTYHYQIVLSGVLVQKCSFANLDLIALSITGAERCALEISFVAFTVPSTGFLTLATDKF